MEKKYLNVVCAVIHDGDMHTEKAAGCIDYNVEDDYRAKFTASQLHSFTASQLHSFTASQLHSFTAEGKLCPNKFTYATV